MAKHQEKMGWSKCVVCARNFFDETNWNLHYGGDKNFVKVFRQIFQIFSNYFPASKNLVKENKNFEEDDKYDLPFCDPCRQDLVKLCKSHGQLEAMQKNISKIVARITQKIIESSAGQTKFQSGNNGIIVIESNNKSVINPKDVDELKKMDQNIDRFHGNIRKQYTPSIILKNCQPPPAATTSNNSRGTNKSKTFLANYFDYLERKILAHFQRTGVDTELPNNSIIEENLTNDNSVENDHDDDHFDFSPPQSQETPHLETNEEIVAMDTGISTKEGKNEESSSSSSAAAAVAGLTLMDQIRRKMVDSPPINCDDSDDVHADSFSKNVKNQRRRSAGPSSSFLNLSQTGQQESVWIGRGVFGMNFQGKKTIFVCYICPKKFHKFADAKRHLLNCKNNRDTIPRTRIAATQLVLQQLRNGQRDFLYRDQYSVSQVDHDVFICHTCRGVFHSFNDVKIHLNKIHDRDTPHTKASLMDGVDGRHFIFYDKPFKKLSSGYKCCSCGVHCKNMCLMKDHLMTCDKADTKKLHCTQCDKEMVGPVASLKSHYAEKHPDIQINLKMIDCGNDIWLCFGGWLFKREEEDDQENFICLLCAQKVIGGITCVRAHTLDHPENKPTTPHQDKTLQCFICQLTFVSEAGLTCHIRTDACQRLKLKVGTNKLSCALCDEENIGSIGPLRNHYRLKHPDTDIDSQTLDCGNNIWLCDGLWLFKEVGRESVGGDDDGKKIFACVLCSVRIDPAKKGPNGLRDHTKNHPKLICETCGRIFKNDAILKLHQQTSHFETFINPEGGLHHQNNDDDEGDGDGDDNDGTAAGGRKKEKFVYNARRGLFYERTEDGGGGFNCCSCVYFSEDHQAMRNHMIHFHIRRGARRSRPVKYVAKIRDTGHQTTCRTRALVVKSVDGRHLYNEKWPYQKTGVGRQWKCLTCDHISCGRSEMVSHLRYIHDERGQDWMCEICGKVFSNSQNLRVHKLTHIEGRIYKCSLCEATFRSRNSCFLHKKRVHYTTTSRLYSCEKCPRTFKCNQTRKRHQTVHSDVRNCQCPDCPKTFKTGTALYRHKKSAHATEKPYACPHCPMRFTQGQSVHRHVKVIHSESRKSEGRPPPPKVRKNRQTVEDDESESEDEESSVETTEESDNSDHP